MSGSLLPNLGLTGDIADHATWGLEGRANDRRLDSLVMPAVTSVLSTPPGSPANGDRYIVGASPTGAWSANAKAIAVWNATLAAWTFYTPKTGWSVYVTSTTSFMRYTGTWVNDELVLNVRQYGAVGDGVTDDEPALNLLFDYVAQATQGPATVYFPKGTYYIKSSLIVDGESAFSPITGLRIFADPGTIIKAATIAAGGVWGGSGAFFKFRASASPATDVIIEGFTCDGQSFGTTSNSVMGVYTTAITGLTVRNCTFKNIGDTALGVSSAPRNDGILLGDTSSAASMRSKDVRIENCRFVNCVRNGISMLDTDGVVVDDCYFENIDNSGIDIEPNLAVQFARDIKITDCTFNNWEIMAVVAIPGAALRGSNYPAQMEGLKVTDCYMDGVLVGGSGVQAYDWIDVDVSGNTIIRVDDPAVYFRSCQNASACNNKIRDLTDNTGAITVDMADTVQSQDIVIHGNRIKNVSGHVIRVVDLDTGSITANIIRNYDTALALRTGISLLTSAATCKNISVLGNVVVGGGGAGGVAGGGVPVSIAVACTRILCLGNVCQENGAGLFSDAIDNEAASTIHGFNCDDQRSTRLFTSSSGTTPLSGDDIGLDGTARKSAYEITVAASAGAGTVSTASDIIKDASICNVLFSPINVAAAAMMGSAVGVYCDRTTTGFDLVHNGNPAGTDAIFMCVGVVL